MRSLTIGLAIAVIAAPLSVRASVVTERWGWSERCRHRGTLRSQPVADGGGAVARFDLSAVPKGARIYRARLVMPLRHGPGPMEQPVLIQPLTAAFEGRGRPAVETPPLPLVPPRFKQFNATDVVRRWSSGALVNHGLWIRNAPGWKASRTWLEVTYEGQLKDPPAAVTGLKAFHRAGQVLLTWNEVNCPFAGKDEVTWDEKQAFNKQRAAGTVAEVSYRIYRHSRPITAATLREAERLDVVPQLSAFDERQIGTEWKGERTGNVRVGLSRVPRVAVEPLTELPVGTGVFVRTTDRPGRFHYAVLCAVDGVENTRDINAGNSLAKPLRETVARPEPILHHEGTHVYDKPRLHRYYLLWTDPPLSHVPGFYHLGVTCPPERPATPAPLYVQAWWWDNGWAGSGARRILPGCISLHMETPWVLHKAIHEGCGTYKAWSQGVVQDYWVRRLRNVLPWLEKQYNTDPSRTYAMSSDWAWHHPDVFAAVHENLTTNPKRSPVGIRSGRFWGSPTTPAETEWGMSAWDYYDIAGYLKTHRTFETPLVYYTPNMHLGDFGTVDKPRFYRAMLDTRRPFIASWGAAVDAGWIYRIKRGDTLAAFSNCSLDSNPGIGMDDGDPKGQINGYLRFDPATAVDEPDRWEMTVWLAGPDKQGRYGAPTDACTVDITPRRCRTFKPQPGDRFAWTNTDLAAGRHVQSGAATADQWKLVTLERATVTTGRNRIRIERRK